MFTVSNWNNVYCIINSWCICINLSCELYIEGCGRVCLSGSRAAQRCEAKTSRDSGIWDSIIIISMIIIIICSSRSRSSSSSSSSSSRSSSSSSSRSSSSSGSSSSESSSSSSSSSSAIIVITLWDGEPWVCEIWPQASKRTSRAPKMST